MKASEFKLNIDETAIIRIKEVLKDKPVGSFFRISVNAGGCAGFSTSFTIDNQTNSDDIIIEKDGIKVVINKFIANFLKEATLIFHSNILSSHFQLQIKEAKDTCSCGSSFSI